MKIKINKIFVSSIIFALTLTSVFAKDNEYNMPKVDEKFTIKLLDDIKVPDDADLKKETKTKNVTLFKKKKIDYTQYLIPTEGYMPVGGEKQNKKLEATISKSPEYNLADCLELALLNNPRIKAAFALSDVYKSRKGQVVSNYTPSVNLGASIARIKPEPTLREIDPYTRYVYGTIGVSQLVYDFGVTQNQYTISKLAHKNSVSNVDVVVNDVIYQVKDAYYYLILAIQNKIVMEETVKQFERSEKQARGFYEVGLKPKINVTIAEVNLADAKAKLIEANYSVDVAISKLNNVMGLPFIAPYVVDAKLPNEDIDLTIKDAIEIANKERPELQIALRNVELVNQELKLAKKAYFPKISFDGSIAGGRGIVDSTNSWYSFGGYLDFPVINPVLIKNQIDEAKHSYKEEQYNTKSTVNDIYLEIQQTYAKLLEKKDRIPVAEFGVKRAVENYDIADGRYNVGLSDPIELKDAQLALMNARISYLKTLYEYNSTKALLEKAIGQTLKGTGKEIRRVDNINEEERQSEIQRVKNIISPEKDNKTNLIEINSKIENKNLEIEKESKM